ncbi:phosphodiester glycosidase family protein [Patescibacteria group bacterium]
MNQKFLPSFLPPQRIVKVSKIIGKIFILATSLSILVFFVLQIRAQTNFYQQSIHSLYAQTSTLKKENQALKTDFERTLADFEMASTHEASLQNKQWAEAIALYQALKNKYLDYQKKGVDVGKIEKNLDEALGLLVGSEYEKLATIINETNNQLDQFLAQKKEADKLAAASSSLSAPISNQPGAGYSRVTVQTEKGNFVVDLVMVDLGQATVVTSTASENNCGHNCPTKPLATHIAENGGYAGINGTYFCPSDYASCAGKINSFDFPVYNSRLGKWLNADKLFWNGRGMIAFPGGSQARFCANASSCNSGGIQAGIINYPTLMANDQIVVNEGNLADSLKNVRGYRGAVGVSGNWLYLLVARGATIPEVAYIMKALGIQNGLNLDGGGSSALYFHGYKVGPGRNLPNAIVIK